LQLFRVVKVLETGFMLAKLKYLWNSQSNFLQQLV